MGLGKSAVIDSGTNVGLGDYDLNFLPKNLATQCRSLIESYHEVYGFARLPDILWQSRLGPFIEGHVELRQLLKKASTTRSAKKSHENFVQITTRILSIEILASSFAGWGAIYPHAAALCCAILKRNGGGTHMPLMEFYLYPPKHMSSTAVATLTPPAVGGAWETDLYRTSSPELGSERQAPNYANAMRNTEDARRSSVNDG